MTIYQLKPRFQNLLRPGVSRLAAAGVTANQVTLAACLGSVAIGIIVALNAGLLWPFLAIPLWLSIRMALNAADGMLAREFGQKSRLGAYLNELTDVVSDAALYAPFALVFPLGGFWIGLAIVLSALTELAGVLGQTIGASRRYDGPVGKSDRALVFGAFGLWVGAGLAVPDWSTWVLAALAGLLAWTMVNRVRAGLAEAAQ